MRILFDSQKEQYKTPFGVLAPNEVCCLHIDIPESCRTTGVELILLYENGEECRRVVLTKQQKRQECYDTFGGSLSILDAGLYFYCFEITTETGRFRLYKQGHDTNMETGDLWQVSCVAARYPVPEALQGAVMYQIFPDRFCKSGETDLSGKIEPYWVHESTNDTPVYLPDANGQMLNNDFYGGNLRGIEEKLPYLHDLGVEILYLNPIFYAWSTHRYDTCDYKRIDPMLGTEADFVSLCNQAHALGMKVILDGVFSHVGSKSPYFQSAISDENSPYRSWFTFRHYPDSYESWWGIKTLPCVRKLEPSYMDYIIHAEDSVVAKWLSLGADGYRLDVVDELPDAFVMRLRERIRKINPNAILIGEVWEDASNKIAYEQRRRYFVDRQLDSVMNYPWRTAILRFLRKEDDGSGLRLAIETILENYPPDVVQGLMNILSTHDTARVLNELVDPLDAPREELAARQIDAQTREQGKMLQRMAAVLQFALPGMPCIYYGDEAGMEGYRDPFNRRFYPWGNEDRNLQAFYAALCRLKHDKMPLRRGKTEILRAEANQFVFKRSWNGQEVFICLNRGDAPIQVQTKAVSLAGGTLQQLADSVTLGKYGFCIYTA